MSQPLTDTSMKKKLTYSQQGSPANHTLLQGNVKHLVMSVIYGVKSSEFWGKRNQDSSWERTCQDSLPLSLEDSSEEYSMTWNPWGIALGGLLMEPRISEQYTVEIEFSSLPTPTCFDATTYPIRKGNNLNQGGRHNVSLKDMMPVFADQMLPTPRTCSAMGAAINPASHLYPNLETVIARELLATPRASQDYKPIRHLSPSEADGTHGRTLVADIGREMLPTPTAQDAKNNGGISQMNQNTIPLNMVLINQSKQEIGDNGESAPRLGLNPEFVEAMMGFPTGWTDLRL